MVTTIEGAVRERAEEQAIAVFGTWMIGGLFLDGWAHQINKPETFFSPWHAVLYSGFGAAVLWFIWHGRSADRNVTAVDRLGTVGLVLFIVGAVGDGVWHEIFGIEVDLEALLSPTHLLLLIGGFLMVTAPVRAAWNDPSERADTWAAWPQIACVTLGAALISFFTMYISAFEYPVGIWPAVDMRMAETEQIQDLSGILASTVILMGAALFILRRWLPPRGAFTLLFGAVALAVTGLNGFDFAYLVLPALLAGAVVDGVHTRLPRLVLFGVAPLVLWSGYFAVIHIVEGLEWSPELWAGAIVLSSAASVLLAALVTGRATCPAA